MMNRRDENAHRKEQFREPPYVTDQRCPDRNEKWVCQLRGGPGSGTFDITITVNSSGEVLTLDYDVTAAEFQTALETHTQVTSGDVECSGGPFPNDPIIIEWKGNYANVDMTNTTLGHDIPTLNPFNLGSSPVRLLTGDFTRWVRGID